MAAYTLPNGREITSEVLLKLRAEHLPGLPLACKTCPVAMWQTTGKADQPESVTVRCYCPAMHVFSWDSRNREEILDCDRLYEPEEDEDPPGNQDDELPAFLRQQMEQRDVQEREEQADNPSEVEP
ncbi:hypothetical protein JH25_27945 [Pseudomonas sp. BRG-100]|uniref:hypothetical protein n=1 Tax=Pseudomonas sp. BRG-100 TaxID=1524267 RepID=UPI0004E6E267|nr:hypothetical protein [Pseudomonas sp. BRG-100]KFF42199.1 hypothetical protein JH25_27945 [Pseudomonas sp. BRG-100]